MVMRRVGETIRPAVISYGTLDSQQRIAFIRFLLAGGKTRLA
jgi:hypothetical protein